MSNIEISAPLVDGSLMPFIEENESCKDAVELIAGDDLRPPARSININIKTTSGKSIQVVIPNSKDSLAKVFIDEKEV